MYAFSCFVKRPFDQVSSASGTADEYDEVSDTDDTIVRGSTVPEEWVGFYSRVLGLGSGSIQRVLKVATLCSGTESPVAAIMQCIGADAVEHVFACDNQQGPKRFIHENFRPPHFYMDTAVL